MPDNVEVVRTALAANSSSWSESDGFPYWHEDAEFESAISVLEAGSFRGHAGLLAYVNAMREAFVRWSVEPREVEEVRPGVVLATWRFRATGHVSGYEVDFVGGGVFELRDGLIVRGRGWTDAEDARRAAAASDP